MLDHRTAGLGVVTTYQNFPQGYSTIPPYANNPSPTVFPSPPEAIAYDPIGMACAVLSLATNVISTALIGYKTWYVIIFGRCREYSRNFRIRIHRRTMQKYQVGGKTAQARAVSVLMFIVESGVGYCLLWVRRFHSTSAVD